MVIDTVELSSAARAQRGTEARFAPAAWDWRSRLFGATRAQRVREHRALLGMIGAPDVHRARVTEGLTVVERFALTEALP